MTKAIYGRWADKLLVTVLFRQYAKRFPPIVQNAV